MPKIIQPKRLNKNITVQSYWQIRNKQKLIKKQSISQAYREDQVQNRYRYLKPTQQAKLFNPLSYFFKNTFSKTKQQTQEYKQHFQDKQFSYVHDYLVSVRFHVAGPLIPMKKYAFGLKSINYNHQLILNILLAHLQCQDSWFLIQAIIKDTQSQSFNYWMKQGLKKLAYQNQNIQANYSSIYQNNFNLTKFQYLFDTLSIFMQASYQKIMENLNDFFKLMNKYFFSHQNKYIRKFSMKSVSYIINNLSLQQNLDLIFNIILNDATVQQAEQIPIGQLLLNRHKAVKGCLSSAQISKVVSTLKQIPKFLANNFEQSSNKNQKKFKQQLTSKIDNILVHYIAGILDLLQTKYGRAQQNQNTAQVVFDLNYCIKAFIAIQEQNLLNQQKLTLVKAFSQFLQNADEKKFLTHNPKHQKYINQTFNLMLTYLQEVSLKLNQQQSIQEQKKYSPEIGRLLGLLFNKSPKQSSKMIISKGIVSFCQNLNIRNSYQLVQKIYSSQIESIQDKNLNKSLGEFLFISFSSYIKQYLSNLTSQTDQQLIILSQLLYSIHQILNRVNFTNSLNLSYLNLNNEILFQKVQKINKIHQFILLSRLILILNFDNQKSSEFMSKFKQSYKNSFNKLIEPFHKSLQILIKQNGKDSQMSVFFYKNHIKNLLKYSHHEVQWVSLAFNLQNCYKDVINKFNKFSKNQNKIQQNNKSIWEQLTLNRVVKIDQNLNLTQILQTQSYLLESRNREVRKEVLQRILQIWDYKILIEQVHRNIIQRIFFIESQQIDINNQRQIKKTFVQLQKDIDSLKLNTNTNKIVNLLGHWILGFCFTGFKLINDNFVSFARKIFDSYPSIISQIVFKFSQYYIYRHSRQFQYDISQNQQFILKTPKIVQKSFEQIKNMQTFYSLMKQDFKIQDQNTIQWIGLQRIAQVFNNARKFKNQQGIKQKLINLLNQYFNEQFFRKNKQLQKCNQNSQQPNDKLILQPKTRFLIVILKMCPNSYLAPFECLHYVSPQYLSLESVRQVKKNRWQVLWVKKLKGNKTSEQISQTVSTSIPLQKMSISEQQLYLHFLWKQIIESNQHKRRTIFEHIRDRIPDMISYLFENLIYKNSLFISQSQKFFELPDSVQIDSLSSRLFYQNKKTLLNFMYILKAIITVFKNYLRNQSKDMSRIVMILRSIIQVVYNKQKKIQQQQNEVQEQIEEGINDQEQNQQEQIQEQNHQNKNNKFVLYKAHRKELYKVLTELFTHYQLNYEQTKSILHEIETTYLKQNKKIQFQMQIQIEQNKSPFLKIAYATVNSVPGILILLRVMSEQIFYHKLLIKFGILKLISSIVQITPNKLQNDNTINQVQQTTKFYKKQSNPHAIKQCLQILSNIFSIKQDQINVKQQHEMQQQHPQSNCNQKYLLTQCKKDLEQLLNSINHYFLYSKNLNQTSGNSNNVQLDYVSHQNKQNLNTIQNNKNKSNLNKTENQINLQENKNLEVFWDIVCKIIKLGQKQNQHTQIQINIGRQWEQIFWTQLNKFSKLKHFKDRALQKLYKIVQISLIYFNRNVSLLQKSSNNQGLQISQFLLKIISILPHISQLSQRIKLNSLIHVNLSSNQSQIKLINKQSIDLVKRINAIKRNGLNIQIDYDQFYGGINTYTQITSNKINLLSHQYIIYNLLPYLSSEQLSVRKTIKQCLNSFLVKISQYFTLEQTQTLKVFNNIFRLLTQQLKKNQIDSVFWSILACIGIFIRFFVYFQNKFLKYFENAHLYSKILKPLMKFSNQTKELNFDSENQSDFFHLICSISQGNKMKALKILKQLCINLKAQNCTQQFKAQQKNICLPHPLPFMLPILQHLVLPLKHFNNQHQYNVQGNLTSTLTLISLQVYENIIPFAKQSLVKKQLKRLSTKIKFNDSTKLNDDNLKKNILVIKIITSIVQGIDSLEKCTGKIKNYVKDHGFSQFHEKLIVNARKMNTEQQSDEQEEIDQKKKIQFGANLEELQEDEAINRNFMMFDRKIMAMEEQQTVIDTQSKSAALIKFLKLHILIPLKLMLFYESKSTKQAKQEQDKSRMLLSVAITKLLIKFPMDMFLFEFQKVLSKICRLLKKRSLQIRQNGRKSLCQIAKIVGPQMLYAIVLQLKFHLRDNFQKHIFNFTTYEIVQSLSPLNQGDIDYCLPLILPMIIDQMFGQSSEQKKMVESGQVPVLNMQTKKKKGHQLLIILAKQISADKIRYMIDYLQKFLKEYLNSEANLSKFQMMINHLTNGLGNNLQFTSPQNAGIFGNMLCESMYELRKQIKIYNFEQEKNQVIHQTTLKVNNNKIQKVGKQSLILQQEAARNGSIFKKMSKEVHEKRNKEILINSLVQFYLAIGSLLIKKQVISLKTLQENKKLIQNFIKIIQFVFECMDHRQNRLVSKSMKLLHQALIWNYQKSSSLQLKQNIQSLRKKVSRKILLFIEKLTSSDEQLLKQSFVILIDLFTQVTITKQFLPSIIAIIKLHTNNQNQDANIAQPYRLLKLIIYKLPQNIYDSLVYQMYQLARINIINSSNKQIRDACKQIAFTYVRNRQFLISSIQLSSINQGAKGNKNSEKSHGQKQNQLTYFDRIKKQLNFYLSNLDCKFQQSQILVLQIIQQWFNNRTKQQIQQVSQLSLLTLSTSIVNGNQNIQKIKKIIEKILKTIDKTKIFQLVQKTLIWINQQRQKSMIRECGYFILSQILSNNIISLQNQTLKKQYLLNENKNNILTGIQTLLQEQSNILDDYIINQRTQKTNKLQNKQWNNILDAIDIQDANPYLSQNRILIFCFEIIQELLKSDEYLNKLKAKHIISKVWKLLSIPKNNIVKKCIDCLIKVKNLTIYLQQQNQFNTKQQPINKTIQQQNKNKLLTFNYKTTIGTLINNSIDKQSISSFLQKFHNQESLQIQKQTFILSFQLLINFLNKLVVKFKIMQPYTQTIYYLINQTILNQKQNEKSQIIYKNQQNINKFIDVLGKISRNQFVSLQCKTMNETIMNIVKQIVSVSQFYKKLSKFQAERKEKKSQQKANLARLAVTDQKAYQDIKKKKIKHQNY